MEALAGRSAIVTGGGSGIGRASAIELAKRGASILVADIDFERASSVADFIVDAGGSAFAFRVDVEREAELSAMVEEAVSRFGRLDVLHNNAAWTDSDLVALDQSVDSVPSETWDRIFAVNLRSVMLATKFAARKMLETGKGSIINTASTLGVQAEAFSVGYGTSKAGIIHLTKYIATFYGKRGIRCNAIAPGLVLTPMVDRNLPHKLKQVFEDACLTPYLGTPEDIAYAVAFLASDEARYITGHCLAVDGGTLAHLPSSGPIAKYFSEEPAGA